jgi:hypothetical protein
LTQKIVYILTGISPNTWWARSGNHRGRAIWTGNIKLFDPVAQEQTGFNLQQAKSQQKLNFASPTPKRRTANRTIREPDRRTQALGTLKTGRVDSAREQNQVESGVGALSACVLLALRKCNRKDRGAGGKKTTGPRLAAVRRAMQGDHTESVAAKATEVTNRHEKTGRRDWAFAPDWRTDESQLMALDVIPRSKIARTKPPYVCSGCFIHAYSNNMINRFHVQ